MFTGVIEELGRLLERTPGKGFDTFVISGAEVMSDLAVGNSITVNGVCLTVVAISADSFTAQVIPETLKKSNLGEMTTGSEVNLERAMQVEARFHGHVVQGHVETVGYINNIIEHDGDVRMTVTLDSYWLRYCVPKGAITLDGVSLTIADISPAGITVALIPFTLELTTLGRKKVGDPVNIETDIFARYVERFLEMDSNEERWDLDPVRLLSWGFGES
ncbi:MAG: riboflavin synthase [Candidatus Marinimicrobia bacterium]|nr:riboflavin synthase [Candidatus Neomarinimicrobiota bacterium]MCH7858477.1 riboflavin synthase [Candidatus Neomarinimicrobiota bacterium]